MALDQRRIEELRDLLLEKGPESAIPGQFSMDRPEGAAAYHRVEPFAEAMYLVMSADEVISDSERDVLRGALRTLTQGELGSAAMAEMLASLDTKLARDGIDIRLDNVAANVWPDPKDRELVLALAAATATADGTIDPKEREAILELAARLGVSSSRVDQMISASAAGLHSAGKGFRL